MDAFYDHDSWDLKDTLPLLYRDEDDPRMFFERGARREIPRKHMSVLNTVDHL